MGGGRHSETAPHKFVIMVRFCDLGGRCRPFRTPAGSPTAAAASWAICVAAVGPPPRKGLSETSSSLNGGGHHRFRGGQPTGDNSADTTMRIPAKSNSIPEGSRTPFRREAEQHSGMIPNTIRSVATLAF